MNYLVSLISEHLLPNYLLTKEMEGRYSKHIFITTKRMGDASMSSRFCNALKIDKKEVQIITVSEDDLQYARIELNNYTFSKEDKYIVNLTGGTKIMSIAAFQHFFKYDADYYYIPIGVNKIKNVRNGEDLLLNYRVNVDEYLSLCGLTFTAENTNRIQNNKGAEFESYITNRIRCEKGIKNKHIYRGVKIFRANETSNDNEIDVMWTADNQIFIGECKVTLNKAMAMDWSKEGGRPIANPVEYLDEIMYKLAAISKDFGLRVHPYVFIKNELNSRIFNPERIKSVNKRMKILGIKGLLSGKDFKEQKLDI